MQVQCYATSLKRPMVGLSRNSAFQVLLFLLFLTAPLHAVETSLSGTPLNDGYHALYNLD